MIKILTVFFLAFTAQGMVAESLKPASFEDQSPRESLRKKIFSTLLSQPGCQIISRKFTGESEFDDSVSKFNAQLLKGLKEKDASSLSPLFHSQIKVKSSQIKASLISIERIAGGKPDLTFFRTYALNNPDGESKAVDCAEDGLQLYPLYGHPLQLGVWIQGTADQEVVRIYAILIPTKDQWKIGAWHIQQWSHGGENFEQWRSMAEDRLKAKDPVGAWLHFDLASKLLDGGKFISFPARTLIEEEKSKLMSRELLLKKMSDLFPKENLVYTSSLLSKNGLALLLRFRVKEEISANGISKLCKEQVDLISKEPWFQTLSGVRCNYILPREAHDKDGIMGGIFIENKISDIKTKN